MPGVEYSLSVDTKGLWRLIRQNVHKDGVMPLRLERNAETGKWHVMSEWTPLDDIVGDQPEHVLHALGIILSPDPDIPLLEEQVKLLNAPPE